MLKQRIQEDMTSAMKAKEEMKLSVIRMLKSAVQYYEINKGGAGYEASDEDVVDVIGKEIKKRREAIELYEKGGRPELAEQEKNELTILQTYLPEQMTEEEVKNLVQKAIETTGASSMADMGKVMGVLMPQVKGKADGNLLSQLVKKALS